MHDVVIRRTLKFIYAAYVAELILIPVAFLAQRELAPDWPWWTPLVLAILILWTLARQIRRLNTKLTLTTDKLRYETGLLSTSTRTIQLAKVQDVRVDQSLAQRIFGVGTLSIETAGESSRLVVPHIDRPHSISDEILKRAELISGTSHGI